LAQATLIKPPCLAASLPRQRQKVSMATSAFGVQPCDILRLDDADVLEGSDLELCDGSRARGLLQVEDGAAQNIFGRMEEFGNDFDDEDELSRPWSLALIVLVVMLWGGVGVAFRAHRRHPPRGDNWSPESSYFGLSLQSGGGPEPYDFIFQAAEMNNDGGYEVGHFPNIFNYYRQSGLSGAAKQAWADGLHADGLHVHNGTLLEFNGSNGAMILPSMDAMVWRRMAPYGPRDSDYSGFNSVVVTVGVNSDSFNRGLGICVESSLGINETEEHKERSYTYSWGKLSARRNYSKFHPDFPEGQFRVEGPGGFADTDMNFTPPGWTTSAKGLNILEVTMRVDGENSVVLKTPDGLHSWTSIWRHKLFDGKDIPAVYVWMDLGGEVGKPLFVGQVSLKLH